MSQHGADILDGENCFAVKQVCVHFMKLLLSFVFHGEITLFVATCSVKEHSVADSLSHLRPCLIEKTD